MKILPRLFALVALAAALLAAPALLAETAAPKARQTQRRDKAPPLDINSATKEQLMTLPGIDAATAQKIVEARPFSKKSKLKSQKVVSPTTYTAIKALIVTKKAKKSTSDPAAGK